MTGNLTLKIAAIFLAVIMWFYVISRGQSEITLVEPVEFTSVPEALQVQSTPSVALRIKGHERHLKNLNPEDLHVFADMSGARAGWNVVELKKDSIRLSVPLKLIRITPSTVKVKVVKSEGAE